jgi:hypothetical protein
MRTYDSDFLRTGQVRGVLVVPGDIRGEVEFQNDINYLLARLGEKVPPLQALGWFPSIPAEERRLRLIPGGYPLPPAGRVELEPFEEPARRSAGSMSVAAVLAALASS